MNWYFELLSDYWGKITLVVLGLFFGAFSVLFGIGIALINFLGWEGAIFLSVTIYFSLVLIFPYMASGAEWLAEFINEHAAQNVEKRMK